MKKQAKLNVAITAFTLVKTLSIASITTRLDKACGKYKEVEE